jgi:hypothetical protein
VPVTNEGPDDRQADAAVRAVASERRLGSAVNSSVMACLWRSANKLTSRKVTENRTAIAIRLNAPRVVASRES